ncbi:MAG: hypothetical protein HY042_03020 [Spirochaetia bacterium]|nr:hypothetical protein [Spirochaetia bacterium]
MDSIDLICKPIDGQFPDYEQVIPQKVDQQIPLDRGLFETAMRQVAVMAGDPSRQVRMTFGKNNLTITASTPDLGEATDTITCGFGGAEITIAFNSNYVMDVIRILDSEKITLGFSSSSAPTTITEENDPQFIAVIMPMKI